jgi:cytochrome c-type biogenesis protein CcmH/NrfF
VKLAAALAVLALALGTPGLARASEQHPTQSELEAELVCPTCHTSLDESDSPVAQQMKAYIRKRIAQGATKSQIIDELVGPPNNLGVAVLGVPRTHGFDLLAWVLPLLGITVGAVVLGAAAWFWSRNRAGEGPGGLATTGPPLDPELERRVDEELARFDG